MAKSSNQKKETSKKKSPSTQNLSSQFGPEESKIAGTSAEPETGLKKLL
ncbi:MAG: hypothetical protein ABIO55_02605 [Ginsengibacter sp.]